MGLRDLDLKVSYSSDTDDLARDFYNPCLRASDTYDRITGYFSSSIYVLAWSALKGFVGAGGKIRLLCSPHLSYDDADGLERGYRARTDDELSGLLIHELKEMLASEDLRDHATLLSCLIASGHLDVRLATVRAEAAASSKRLFHDKVGLFTDELGDLVGFGGSMNETYAGLRANVESVSVWPSWDGGRDAQRVRDAAERFEHLWSGRVQGVQVHEMPEAAREVIRRVASDSDLDAAFQRAKASTASREMRAVYETGLRRHQEAALAKWRENEYVGLLSHATGSGKTRTGLAAMGEAIADNLTPIVAVPSTLLLEQWVAEVREHLGVQALRCGGGNDAWRSGRLVRAAVESDSPQVVVAVNNSAATTAFLTQLRGRGSKVLFVADEVHRLGSPSFTPLLEQLNAARRLGLSATPQRAGDAEGTQRVIEFFDRTVHMYSLKDALDDGYLTPYQYDVSFVSLNDNEQERWDELTKKVKRAYGRLQGSGETATFPDQVRNLLIQRARIVKNAAAKPEHAAHVLAERYGSDQRWLVYCDNIDQVHATISHLEDRGVAALPYYRGMPDDAGQVLEAFRHTGGVVVSIRCLDEGVDIPAADHALLLASSQNPREHIQRRGRVLRTAPGKRVAKLHDVATLPATVDLEDETWKVAAAELARAVSFDAWALVPGRARRQLETKWFELGLPPKLLDEAAAAGIETETEDEES